MKQRLAITTLVIACIAVWAWSFSGVFVSDAARECTRLYTAARSAADSLATDSVVPTGRYQTLEPRSCGSIRHAARWTPVP